MHAVPRVLEKSPAGDPRLNLVMPRQSVKLIEIGLAPPR
jgi:hypothetical protein